ncbi:MAG: hypothetical protein DGJ47_000390 [Rickettsiaceae bacterium]
MEPISKEEELEIKNLFEEIVTVANIWRINDLEGFKSAKDIINTEFPTPPQEQVERSVENLEKLYKHVEQMEKSFGNGTFDAVKESLTSPQIYSILKKFAPEQLKKPEIEEIFRPQLNDKDYKKEVELYDLQSELEKINIPFKKEDTKRLHEKANQEQDADELVTEFILRKDKKNNKNYELEHTLERIDQIIDIIEKKAPTIASELFPKGIKKAKEELKQKETINHKIIDCVHDILDTTRASPEGVSIYRELTESKDRRFYNPTQRLGASRTTEHKTQAFGDLLDIVYSNPNYNTFVKKELTNQKMYLAIKELAPEKLEKPKFKELFEEAKKTYDGQKLDEVAKDVEKLLNSPDLKNTLGENNTKKMQESFSKQKEKMKDVDPDKKAQYLEEGIKDMYKTIKKSEKYANKSKAAKYVKYIKYKLQSIATYGFSKNAKLKSIAAKFAVDNKNVDNIKKENLSKAKITLNVARTKTNKISSGFGPR